MRRAAPVHYYNFGWRDMTSPTVKRALQIVKCMALHVERGEKVCASIASCA